MAGAAPPVPVPPGPGPGNDIADVVGLSVGHKHRVDAGFLSGTTVLLGPPGGMVAGVDVRGAAPGTRETDLLAPTATVQRIHALVLTGGSAYGLAVADGVMQVLGERGFGLQVGTPGQVVPIVPAAALFDLGRGGDFRSRPDAAFGAAAVRRAIAGHDTALGAVGAGTGAVSSGLKGGVGSASVVLPTGTTVAALVVGNAVGSPLDPADGSLLGGRKLLTDDLLGVAALAPPDPDELADLQRATAPPARRLQLSGPEQPEIRNTTLGVVATDATLTKAQCARLAVTAHDGLARAVDPVHTMWDGDTIFGVATATGPVPDELGLHLILTAAADVVTRAFVRGLVAARTVRTTAGHWPGYLDLAPSLDVRRGAPAGPAAGR